MKHSTLLSLGTILAISGCEKLPELPIAGKNSDTEDLGQTDAEPADSPETPAVSLTPEQIIADFKSKKSTRLTETDVLELANLESGLDQIEELNLTGSRLGPKSMAALGNFSGLKKLHLRAASFLGGSLEAISSLPSLQWLDLSQTATNNSELVHVANMTELKVLKLAQTVINDDGLQQLTKLSALEELDISGTETVGTGLAALGSQGAKAPLKVLNASHTRVGTQGFRFVNQFPLQELLVSKAMVTDASLTGLRGCNKLTLLNLSYNRITDESAKWLLSSKLLENIDLSGNSAIGDGTLQELQTLTTLTELDLTKTSSSAKAIQMFQQRLPNCTVRITEQ